MTPDGPSDVDLRAVPASADAGLGERLIADIARLVGHAVLNDLTIVRLFADTIGQGLDADDPERAHLARISEVSVHASAMLRLLGQLAGGDGFVGDVDVVRLLSDMTVLLRAVVAPAELVVDLPEGPARRRIDVGATRLAIVEATLSVRQGIGAAGRVYVSMLFGEVGPVVMLSSTEGVRVQVPVVDAGATVDVVIDLES